MTGGRWNYTQTLLREVLGEIAKDPEVLRRFPALAARLAQLGPDLFGIIKMLDWDLSGDTLIRDDALWEAEALRRLGAPDPPTSDTK